MHTVLLTIILLGSLLVTRLPAAYATRYVHVVVIDGARYSETFGDSTHQFIPFIWNRLRPLGTTCTRFYNDSLTYTSPAHASLASGVWLNAPNDASAVPSAPTVFEYARKELNWPQSDNFVILGKEKLAAIASSTHPEYGRVFGASVRYAAAPFDDTLTWRNIREVFQSHHPRIAIINLAEVDVWGHSGIWEEYIRAIRNADSIVHEVWTLIQTDPVYKDKTTLIVTNDHGRHDTGDWSSHGCGCDGCRHLMFLMLGPDTRAGTVDTVHRTLIDIAPTIGELLDFSTPHVKGISIVPILPPATPVLMTPPDAVIHQPLDITLVWKQVPRASRYHLQLSSAPSFDTLLVNDSLIGWNTRSVGPLELKTVYYWRVRSKNRGGSGPWSETRRFTTIPTHPPVVFLTGPENGAVFPVDSIICSWSTRSSDVDSYCLEVGLDSLLTRKILVDTLVTTTFRTFKSSRKRVVLWWRVKASYLLGWAGWSETRHVIVDVPFTVKKPDRYALSITGGHSGHSPFVLRYALPSAATVSIRIFTLGGRHVSTLVDSWQTPDLYRIDLPSSALPRGFCVIDFETGAFRKTRLHFRN